MVTTAYINVWGQRVGAVAWNPDTALGSFEYDPKFALDRYPVSPIKMPDKDRIYSFPELGLSETFRGLPGLLADALPDKYGKELINVWLAQQGRPENSLNPVELLCFIGKRGMGALEFEPVLQSKATMSYTLELSSLIETTKSLLEKKENIHLQTSGEMRDVMLDVLKMGTSAGGARPKAIIAYNRQTGEIKSGQTSSEDGFDHWIIKFDGVSDVQFGETLGYGRVEMAYYKMATDFGIKMTESRLIEENGRAHFMTRRFDRANGRKVHMQTFCALQHYDFSNITSYSYEQLYQTMRFLKLTYAEAEQMYRRMVFNVIARNCDDHTKNFSFLMTQHEGKWKLAPAYDVCFAYRPGSLWVSQHNLSINGKRKDFSRRDLLQVAEQNSIRTPDKIIDECIDIVGNWETYAKNYSVGEKRIGAIAALLLKKL
ncbi:type II toxin-antitoxin system HipA family toxin [Sinomicrobium soli]|uniref:type II toxin-antitoxin system HipA family toxin n=1 Tax=Sinomicrobium sp. N-1-3-6 TaxID=2219864 RepID=UPI000DCBF41E|nr:type II toxin-antitoxin system HipA family toxin [Sinomicrobium sp. N-1-3-6]RAV29893.1 type II toxin-antitoxin system HipA family toxin [Sinomicrobium sp. N-1-3-6]